MADLNFSYDNNTMIILLDEYPLKKPSNIVYNK